MSLPTDQTVNSPVVITIVEKINKQQKVSVQDNVNIKHQFDDDNNKNNNKNNIILSEHG